MNYNIQELQANLSQLVKDFQNLRQTHQDKKNIHNKNKKSVLVRIPKTIFLQRVLIYVSQKDIVKVSSVSKIFRKLIYSPVGWKILSYTRYPIKYKYTIQKVQQDNQFQDFNVGSMIVDPSQINLLKQKRKILNDTLKNEYQKYLISKQKYEAVLQRIRVQKKLQLKYRDKGKILQQQINLLDSRNNEYKQTLKQLNDEFQEKIKLVNEQQQKLMIQRNKLQSQKEVLVFKIRQFQNDIEKIKKQGIKSKQMLKKVKSFLFYKQI